MKRLFLLAVLALAACVWLAIDTQPQTPLLAPPTADDVRIAEDLARRAEAGSGTDMLYSWIALDSALRLIGQITGAQRLAISSVPGTEGHVTGQASLALPLGLWLNPALTLRNGETLADARVRLGNLPLPRFLSQMLIAQALTQLGEGPTAWPAPEVLISHVDITKQGLRARLSLPFAAIMAMGGRDSPTAASHDLFCSRLSALPGNASLPLPELFRLAFDDPKATAHSSQAQLNRERLLLMAMLSAPADARRALPGSRLPKSCPQEGVALMLHGRADLAQHWIISAALAARFGSDISSALGFWKELSDSGANGSGFSYVDLAADCAGMSWGITLASPGTAAPAARKLATATEAELMPEEALHLEEGLSEAQFAARHGGIKHAACMRRLMKNSQAARASAR